MPICMEWPLPIVMLAAGSARRPVVRSRDTYDGVNIVTVLLEPRGHSTFYRIEYDRRYQPC